MRKLPLWFIAAVLGVQAQTPNGANPFAAITVNPNGSQTLTGHVPLEVRDGTAVFKYHAKLDIDARVVLPLRNQSELAKLLDDLYDRRSPIFHHFLSPAEFAQRFSVLCN
jgi:subtilase family serine protease